MIGLLACLALGITPAIQADRPAPEPASESALEPVVQEPGAEPGSTGPALRGVPDRMGREAIQSTLDQALGWLVEAQNEDGSFGSGALEGVLEMGFAVETYSNWQYAAHGLALVALLEVPESEAVLEVLEKAIRWLDQRREPRRGSHWDVDYTWSALYGLVASAAVASDERFADGPLGEAMERVGRTSWKILKRNEVPSGGWAYYDDPPFTARPTWATSFCTALVLPALKQAERLGWIDQSESSRRALVTLQRAHLPTGAYTYNASDGVQRIQAGESINNVKGSLGRIQVANWARAAVGDKTMTLDVMREGLELFFEHHKFLDIARMRPIPHEAYYANAGYFYLFAHFYAAQVIELLPREEREDFHARLRPHLAKIQEANGSTVDFLGTSYTRTAGTAMTVYALSIGLGSDE